MITPPWQGRVFEHLRATWPSEGAGRVVSRETAFRILVDERGPDTNGDLFTVGSGERAWTVSIDPPHRAKTIRTTIRVIGGSAPTLEAKVFTGPRFSFVPDVDRRGMPGKGRDANTRIELVIRSEISASIDEPPVIVEARWVQSPAAVLRQEYVDARLGAPAGQPVKVPEWSEIVPARADVAPPIASEAHPSVIIDEGVGRLVRALRAAHPGPMTPTSGFRNPRLNAEVGGVPRSAHAGGRALDVTVEPEGPAGAAARLDLYRAAAGLRLAGSLLVLLEQDARALAPGGVVPTSIDAIYTERIRIASLVNDGSKLRLTFERERRTATRWETFSPVIETSKLFPPGAKEGSTVTLAGAVVVVDAPPGEVAVGDVWRMQTPWRSLLERSTHVHLQI